MFRKNNYVCLFPWLENVHAFKCTGQITDTIAERNNLNGYIVTYANDDYSTFIKYCNNTQIIFLKGKFKPGGKKTFMDLLLFIIVHSKQIDRLYLYHFEADQIVMPFIGYIYKQINKRGFLHIRLEAEPRDLPKEFPKIYGSNLLVKIKSKIGESFYRMADLVGSGDDTQIAWLKKKYLWNLAGDKVKTQYNGYRFFKGTKEPPAFSDKKNYILLAGRFDSPQKGLDVFLKALQLVNLKDWQIVILGNLKENQVTQIRQIELTNQNVSGKIHLKGYIQDIVEYSNYLNESKIFCLPSRSDGIPLVIPEALARGCVLVSSDCIQEFIIDHGKFGFSFTNGDSLELARTLNHLIDNPGSLQAMSEKSKLRATNLFYWDNIVDKLEIIHSKRDL